MEITFLGGTETVTGSKYLLVSGKTQILIDCGLFQGYKWLRQRNWQPLPIDIKNLDAVILTHAHLDHSGYLPVLYKRGYRGPVYCQRATLELCQILLADSGHIQEADARYHSRHKIGRHDHPEPLYGQQDAASALTLFKPVDFGQKFSVGEFNIYLQDAGHILGASSIIVESGGKRVGFSGDVGRLSDTMMNAPKPLPSLDLLLLESTYGDRRHESQDAFEELAEVVNAVANDHGVLLIPAFSVGRAQLLQHMLVTLKQRGLIEPLPIYLDSPMAINVTDVYCRYVDQHKLSPQQCSDMGHGITYTRSVDESKALSEISRPHIIIAGSGMATGGRILHHFQHLIHKSSTTVLFSGFQAGGTRGAKMLDGAESIKVFGKWLPVKANIKLIPGLSAHADYVEMTEWLRRSELAKGTPIQLVHGSMDALENFRTHLQEHTQFQVEVASYRSIYRL